ncbi:RNB domain-containing ribonuclease [Helicobacter cetorum]|uniref:Ribonuclease R n=1 Tax=Helicobacter cetorum (strain ATCC BAA-540 / CCUG 52418 / MIT 99-5656) TaxID=1163745 RepID=I0EQ83_HELCM|nr:ribonuclease R family protein [Helicobacter cetorum]AFI05102.1 ribonuclease R [Helicobacter cetorum MIT 99-5656]
MQGFLRSLFFGVKGIPKKFAPLVERGVLKEVVDFKNQRYILKEGFEIARVQRVHKNKAFLISLARSYPKDPLIRNLPHSLDSNAIILCAIKPHKNRPIAFFKAVITDEAPFMLGYLAKKNNQIIALSFKEPFKKALVLKHSQKSLLGLPRNCVVKIDTKKRKISEILGALEDPLLDENLSLSLFDRIKDFSKDCLNLAHHYAQIKATDFKNRINYSRIPFITIDPKDAKDFDDAIFYDREKNVLFVAIADVSEFVPKHSSLDTEARLRGFSVYFPNSVYPMLPLSLSQGACSLKAKEKRLALVYEIPLNALENAQLFQGIIEVRANCSYEEINHFLSHKKSSLSKELQKSLLGFLEVALKLKDKRLKKGFDFNAFENKLYLNEEGRIEKIEIEKASYAHTLIEEAMLLANQSSARLLDRHFHNKGIYRIHKEPSLEQQKRLYAKLFDYDIIRPKNMGFFPFLEYALKVAKEKKLEREVARLIIKSQNEALYSFTQESHFGLGFFSYTHFTSPIRRYSDLALHRLLKELLFHQAKGCSYLLEEMPPLCSELNALQKKVALIERDFVKRKYTRLALEHLEEEFQGIVLEIKDEVVVGLEGKLVGLKVLVKTPKTFRVLEKVRVKITHADLVLGQVKGEIIERI